MTQAPPGRQVQRARGRRVLAAAVVLAHRAGVLHGGAEQGVGQRRLAGARRAEQHQRLAGLRNVGEARRRRRVGGVDDERRRPRPASAGATTREALVEQRRVGGGDVGLGQHDHRRHAAGVGQRQVALEAAQVEVVVEAHHEQGRVDVADDRMAAAVAVAAGDVRRRRHARVHPSARPQRRAPRAPSRRRRASCRRRAAAAPGAATGRAVRSAMPSCSCTVSRCTTVTRRSSRARVAALCAQTGACSTSAGVSPTRCRRSKSK